MISHMIFYLSIIFHKYLFHGTRNNFIFIKYYNFWTYKCYNRNICLIFKILSAIKMIDIVWKKLKYRYESHTTYVTHKYHWQAYQSTLYQCHWFYIAIYQIIIGLLYFLFLLIGQMFITNTLFVTSVKM